jgi:hypothetical protein
MPVRVLTQTAVVAMGIIVLACVIGADAAWVDRHFLPDFFKSQPRRHELALLWRIAAGTLGLALVVFSRPLARNIAAVARVSLAIVLALLASEGLLRTTEWQARHEAPRGREPLQQPDERLGWVLVPARAGHRVFGEQRVEYAFDVHGYRVHRLGDAVDPSRPSILFTGESIMLGTGLDWDQSVPAQTESLVGIQGVNLAVNGYASDQAYLRLATELPRFSRPVAVVSLFMPTLLPRNLDRDRPYLDATLHWHAAQKPWRLVALARKLVRYSSDAEIEQGLARTCAALMETARLARLRGAQPLILVPQFGPETDSERRFRQRILDEAGLDYVQVPLDPGWRVAGDKHPDARAARAMAAAIAARLKPG